MRGLYPIKQAQKACVLLVIFMTGLIGFGALSHAKDTQQSHDGLTEKSPLSFINNPRLAKQNWMLSCMGCHKVDGSGIPVEMPSLVGHVSKFLDVEGGREYLGYVPGIAHAPIQDDELADLMNWMLVTFDPENIPKSFTPYTGEEVASLRRFKTSTSINDVREGLVEKIEKTP